MRGAAAIFVLALTTAGALPGYSVLTHEAVVDTVWEPHILPLMRARFPQATPEELEKARAFVYGGTLIQDLGYYPFASKLFSDLTHYVRAGDFVANLLQQAQTVEEYAFALGALAHYFGDRAGHPMAINPAVALTYPKLRRKFGDRVTYADHRGSHVKTEFAFDVAMAVSGHYAPKSYRAFIGFEVSKPVLERAFAQTYGLPLSELFGSIDLALGTYRYMVGAILPNITVVAWQYRKDEIMHNLPGMTRAKFVYRYSRKDYDREFGNGYTRPGIGTRVLAFCLRLVPKVGPFQGLAFRVPPPEAVRLFQESVQTTTADYSAALEKLRRSAPEFDDINLDTGAPVVPGSYTLEDKAYREWLARLARARFAGMNSGVRTAILRFYAGESGGQTPGVSQSLAALQAWQPEGTR